MGTCPPQSTAGQKHTGLGMLGAVLEELGAGAGGLSGVVVAFWGDMCSIVEENKIASGGGEGDWGNGWWKW